MRRTLLLVIAIAIPIAMATTWSTSYDRHESSDRSRLIGGPGVLAAASPTEKTMSLFDRMGYDPLSVREKGIFTGRNLKRHRVMIAKRTKEGKWCVVHTQEDRLGESCATNLFEHAPVHILESFTSSEGGQTLTYQLVGVADTHVASVDVVDTRSVTRSADLKDGAVYFELSPSELAEGTKAARVLAYGGGARLLASIDLEPAG